MASMQTKAGDKRNPGPRRSSWMCICFSVGLTWRYVYDRASSPPPPCVLKDWMMVSTLNFWCSQSTASVGEMRSGCLFPDGRSTRMQAAAGHKLTTLKVTGDAPITTLVFFLLPCCIVLVPLRKLLLQLKTGTRFHFLFRFVFFFQVFDTKKLVEGPVWIRLLENSLTRDGEFEHNFVQISQETICIISPWTLFGYIRTTDGAMSLTHFSSPSIITKAQSYGTSSIEESALSAPFFCLSLLCKKKW